MKKDIRSYLYIAFVLICFIAIQPIVLTAGNDWLYFARDINSANTKYYYDLGSVTYLPDGHLSVWIKIASTVSNQTLHTEISCPGRLFRIVQPPKVAWNGWWDYFQNKEALKTQYVVSGWLEIPPDSEINILQRQLCNYPKKDWN